MFARDSSAMKEGDGPELDNLLSSGLPNHTTTRRQSFTTRSGRSKPISMPIKILGTALTVVSFLALTLILGGLTSSLPESANSRVRPVEESSSLPLIQRVLIRPAANNEGIGSALQRVKGSIILAEAILNATFLLGEAESEHNYTTSRLLNAKYFESALPLGKTCVLGHYLHWEERQDLLHAVCNGSKPIQADELRRRLQPCHIIIDDIPDELYEDLNGCIRPSIRERLGGVEERRLGTSKKLSVGIHIRWGDAAGPQGAKTFRGSMDIDNINRVMRDVRRRYSATGLDIRVAMENHDQSVLDGLEFTDYTMVDSSNTISDLKALADNDLILLGSSSYGALSNIMAPKGLTIVEGWDSEHKYLDSGRERVLMQEYTAESLDALDAILGW